MDLSDYANQIAGTDVLEKGDDHVELLIAGLIGETGSVASELKKARRERRAYPAYQRALQRELGDWLWYFTRVADETDYDLSNLPDNPRRHATSERSAALQLAVACGRIANAVKAPAPHLEEAWDAYLALLLRTGDTVDEIKAASLKKLHTLWVALEDPSRAPRVEDYLPLFDDGYPEEDQFPRELVFEFRELRRADGRATGIVRVNGLNIGARLTDNIDEGDHYRLHDVFHIANMVFLGWSPVLRSLLNCKRKSQPNVDENQDGARALIIEEAVTAAIFQQAKHLRSFAEVKHVGYSVLNLIQTLVAGYEVDRVPLWQWDHAIRESYRVFRLLRDNRGGAVRVSLVARTMEYEAPKP